METKTTNQNEKATFDFSSANLPETLYNKPKPETFEFVKPLKHPTQQKRVELIEKQKCELIAATATIDNQAATIKTFEKAFEIKDRTIKKQSDELEKLGETCGNLVRTKLRNEAAIADLTKRNGNLKTLVNDQTERIEVMQNELKNYESAIAVLEGQNNKLNRKCDELNDGLQELKITKSKIYTCLFIFGLIIAIESLVIWAN